MDQDFNSADVSTGNGSGGGRGGDVGSHNTTNTNHDNATDNGDTFIANGKKKVYEFASAFRGNGYTVINNAGANLNHSSTHSTVDSSVHSSIDSSVHNNYTPRYTFPPPTLAHHLPLPSMTREHHSNEPAETTPQHGAPKVPCSTEERQLFKDLLLRLGKVDLQEIGVDLPPDSRAFVRELEFQREIIEQADRYEAEIRVLLEQMEAGRDHSEKAREDLEQEGQTPQDSMTHVETKRLPRDHHCAFVSNDDESNVRELIRMLQWLNDAVEDLATTLAGCFPSKVLRLKLSESVLALFPRRRNALIAEYIKAGIARTVTGRDIIIPSIRCLFNTVLITHVFEPFLPGLDADRSEEFHEIYDRISRYELRERCVLWRSVTYAHADSHRDDQKHAMSLARQFLVAVQDFVPMLAPPALVVNVPNILTMFSSRAAVIVLDAIKLQDHARTKCLLHDYDFFLPSPKSKFDSRSMTADQVMQRGTVGGEDSMVLVGTKLGLQVIEAEGHDKITTKTLVKANVICGRLAQKMSTRM